MSRAVPLFVALLVLLEGACGRSPKYYLDRGNQLSAKGSYSDAVLNYRKALQKDPTFGEAYYQLALAQLKLQKAREGFDALNRAAELLPNREDVKVTLADLSLAAYMSDQRHPDVLHQKVATIADQLIAKDPKSYHGLRLRAHLAAADRSLPEAEEFYRQANEAKPMQPEVILGWTQVRLQGNDPKKGEELALQFIEKNKTYGPIYEVLFRYYMQSNRFDNAEGILKTRMANNPNDAAPRLLLAAFYANRKREDDLQTTLKGMLNNPKTFPQAYLQAGDLYARLQRWDDAMQQYRAGEQAYPKDKVLYEKKRADVWLAQGKGEQAEEVVSGILQQQPDDEAAKGVKASLLLASRKPEKVREAVALFQTLVDKNPENATWRFNLGRALAANGDDGARAQLEQAVKLRRDFLPPRLLLAEISQAKRDYQTSLRYENEILAINPKLPRIRLLRTVSLMNTGNTAQARSELMELEQIAPKDLDVQLEFASLDLHEKRFPAAETRLRKIVAEARGDVRPVSGLVSMLAAENRLDEALQMVQEQSKEHPESKPLRGLVASTAVQAQKYDIAIAEYQRLVAEAPSSAAVHMALGEAYRRKGDLTSAISYYQKASSLAPQDIVPLALLGETYLFSGQKTQALDAYRHALQLRPDSPVLMNATAYLIAETGGSLDEALKLAQKALQSDSRQPNFSDTLGWIYFKQNQDDNAMQVFRSLTAKNPENPTFHYHLGMVLLKKGDKATAAQELKVALTKKPSGEVRREIETALGKIG